jgi:hypothetical protein
MKGRLMTPTEPEPTPDPEPWPDPQPDPADEPAHGDTTPDEGDG